MQKNHFKKQLDQARKDIILQQMDVAALDVLACRLPQNVFMLSGYPSYLGESLVVFPRLAEPTLMLPVDEECFGRESWIKDVRTFTMGQDGSGAALQPILQDLAIEKGLQKLVIGYEAILEDIACPYPTTSVPGAAICEMLRTVFPDADFHDATAMLGAAQVLKTPREIDAIRTASEIAEFGLDAARAAIGAGARESEVAGLAQNEALSKGIGHKGSSRVAAFTRCLSGNRSATAYQRLSCTGDREIRKGDLVLIELTVYVDGFWSKLARTFVVGPPKPRVREMYEVCLEAQEKATAAVVDGVKAAAVERTVRDFVADRGYAESFKGILGHGIGFTPSRLARPRFHSASDDVLQPDVVHTIELGLFAADLGGIKIGDVVVDLGHGVEYLTQIERSLDWAMC